MTDQSKQERFEEWLAREMHAGTVIGDPEWWAPRIRRALLERPQEATGTAASHAAALANDLLERVHAATGIDDKNVRIPVSRARWIIKALSDAENAARPVEPLKPCGWAYDEDGIWQTDCGESFVLMEGTPEDNDFRFCCYCGKNLPHWNPSTKSGDAT